MHFFRKYMPRRVLRIFEWLSSWLYVNSFQVSTEVRSDVYVLHEHPYPPFLRAHRAKWYSVLQCVAVCCSVLQGIAVCCSVLQYVAVCCSALPLNISILLPSAPTVQCVAVNYSVFQHVAACCSMLQFVVRCSVVQCSAPEHLYPPPLRAHRQPPRQHHQEAREIAMWGGKRWARERRWGALGR